MRMLCVSALALLFSGAVLAQAGETRPNETKPEPAPAATEEKAAKGVEFKTDLEEAKKLAAAEGKKLLLYFTIPN